MKEKIVALYDEAWLMESSLGEKRIEAFENVLKETKKALELLPEDTELLQIKVNACGQLRRIEESLEELKFLIEKGVSLISNYMSIIDAYKKLNNYPEALKYMKLLLEEDGGTPRYRYDEYADLLRKNDLIEEAQEAQKIYEEYQKEEQAKWDDPNHYYNYK